MPIYEYICLDCRRRLSFFIRRQEETDELKCSYCNGVRLQRIMSRFASFKSEEERLESLADPGSWSGLDENDPKSIAKFIKKMGSELGEDISKDEIDQMADEAAREAETGFSGDGDLADTGDNSSSTDSLGDVD